MFNQKECVRCRDWFLEEDVFSLDTQNHEGEPVYVCEGCLLPLEQDLFYGQCCTMLRRGLPVDNISY
ncbi:hypothetical protein QUF76_15545 [Desulfobacterales bacterium HSG16]|nr:hypothetical protein [Desulfobacterales bacterium HSG16]